MTTLVRLILIALGIITGVLLGGWGGPVLFNLPIMIIAGIILFSGAVLVLRHNDGSQAAPVRVARQRMMTGTEVSH